MKLRRRREKGARPQGDSQLREVGIAGQADCPLESKAPVRMMIVYVVVDHLAADDCADSTIVKPRAFEYLILYSRTQSSYGNNHFKR